MPFPPNIKQEALFRSKRSCCLCNEFAGLYTNVHHIIQEADGGSNLIENAVVLCLRCHGEVGHYNPRHPIGDKYSREEVRRHRDAWWDWCRSNPNAPPPKHPILISPPVLEVVKGYQQKRSSFRVHNTTNDFFYDTWVQLELELNGIEVNDVLINESQRTIRENPSLKGGDMIVEGASGWTESGSQALWVIISDLHPSETKEFVVNYSGGASSGKSSKLSASITVIAFEASPTSSVATVNPATSMNEANWISKGHLVNNFRIRFHRYSPYSFERIAGKAIVKYSISYLQPHYSVKTEEAFADNSNLDAFKFVQTNSDEVFAAYDEAAKNFYELWKSEIIPISEGENIHVEELNIEIPGGRLDSVAFHFAVKEDVYFVPESYESPWRFANATSLNAYCIEEFRVTREALPSEAPIVTYRVFHSSPAQSSA